LQNLILRHNYISRKRFFEPLRAHLTSKFAKKTKEFLATIQMDIKKMQNADLEPIRKVAKISLGKIVKEK
jgi:hypothetical protein